MGVEKRKSCSHQTVSLDAIQAVYSTQNLSHTQLLTRLCWLTAHLCLWPFSLVWLMNAFSFGIFAPNLFVDSHIWPHHHHSYLPPACTFFFDLENSPGARPPFEFLGAFCTPTSVNVGTQLSQRQKNKPLQSDQTRICNEWQSNRHYCFVFSFDECVRLSKQDAVCVGLKVVLLSSLSHTLG